MLIAIYLEICITSNVIFLPDVGEGLIWILSVLVEMRYYFLFERNGSDAMKGAIDKVVNECTRDAEINE